jgi:hypothetical protein
MLEMENELEKSGFDKRLSDELLRGCQMTAWENLIEEKVILDLLNR